MDSGGGYGGGGGDAWGGPIGSYWIGQDGNVWVAGADGTNSAGAYDASSDNYWSSRGFTKINDPNVGGALVESIPNSDGTGTGGTGGTSNAAANAQKIAGYNDEISGYNDAIGRLMPTYNANIANLTGTRNTRRNDLASDFGLATRDYNTQRTDTLEDRRSAAQGSIDDNRARLQALQRLLGSQGAGNSSAAKFLVPHLAQTQGVKDLGAIQRTFGRNLRDTDIAYGDTERDRDKTYSDIDSAYNISQANFEAQRMQDRAGLLDQIRTANINRDQVGGGVAGDYSGSNFSQSAINQLMNQAIGLRTNDAIPLIGDVQYNAPALSNYNLTTGGLGKLFGQNAQPLAPANSTIYNPTEEEELV